MWSDKNRRTGGGQILAQAGDAFSVVKGGKNYDFRSRREIPDELVIGFQAKQMHPVSFLLKTPGHVDDVSADPADHPVAYKGNVNFPVIATVMFFQRFLLFTPDYQTVMCRGPGSPFQRAGSILPDRYRDEKIKRYTRSFRYPI